jgi:chloride channel, nucleotide-sensitive, 1A
MSLVSAQYCKKRENSGSRPMMRRGRIHRGEDGGLQLGDDESLQLTRSDITMSLGVAEPAIGNGTLYVTSRRVIWISSDNPEDERTYDIDIGYIGLHAISKDPNSYPLPCVYCQLGYESGDETEGGDEEVVVPPTELFFAPQHSSDEELKHIFDALSLAAMLNPDLDDSGAEEGQTELITSLVDTRSSSSSNDATNRLQEWDDKLVDS